MATLTDKYVNALVAANDAKTAERKANIQAQYNAWAKKQNALATPEMQPVEMQTVETQEIPSLKPVEYPSQINQLVQTVNQQRKKNEEKKNGNEVVMDENGMADIDSVKRNARSTTSQRQADAAKKKAEKAKSTDVVMDENGVVDVDSVKRNARATTPQRQADWANAQLAKGNYPQAQYTADGKLDVAALQNDPRIQQMQTRALNDKGVVHEETNATKLINERANTLLDPTYKMTKDDKANFDKLVEQWRKENPQAAYEWDNNFDGEVYHWDFLDKYPEIRTIMDVEQKYDPFASFANGLRGSFDFPQLVGAQIGKLFSDEEGDKKIEEDLARRQQQIANARTQHGIASGLGGFYGLAMQNNIISDAAKALGLFGEAANGGSKLIPFLQEQAVQLGADALTQTAPIVARDIYENKDAGTVAKDALADLGTNALFNLGLGGAEIGLNALGARKAAKQALNSVPVNQADDIVEQAAKSAPIDDVVKAVDDVPARNAVEEAIDTAKKALNDVPAKQVIDEAQNVKEAVRESAEIIFHRNPATKELSTNGKALMRRMNEIGNEVNGNENAMKVWLDYVDELEKADAGQENAFRAVSDELFNALGTDTARKNIEEAYDLVINNEVPKTFSGSQVDELNPLFNLLEASRLEDVKYAPIEVRNGIEDVLYKNMDAIQKSEILQNKLMDVEQAYDKWVEAIYSGVGDTKRLGMDVHNAINRMNTALKNEGLDQIKVDRYAYTRPDYLMNQVKPEGYVAPTEKRVLNDLAKEDVVTDKQPFDASTVNAGRATHIDEMYNGSKPVRIGNGAEKYTISDESYQKAVDTVNQASIDSRLYPQGKKNILSKAYDAIFGSKGQKIVLDNVEFEGKPYAVQLNKNAVSKVINSNFPEADVLSVLEELDDVIKKGDYVGSGVYHPHGSHLNKEVGRVDYFEIPVNINGKDYVLKYTVEAEPSVNNFRTYHLIDEVDLVPSNSVSRHGVQAAAHTNGTQGLLTSNIADVTKNVNEGEVKAVAENAEDAVRMNVAPEPKAVTGTGTVVPLEPGEAETIERGFSKNVREGRVDASDEVRKMAEENPNTYQRLSNQVTSDSVDEIASKGYDYARNQYELMKGTNDARFAPLGQKVARQLSDAGRHNEAAAILDEVAEELTKAGQMTQAAYITMLKDDPLTALASVQKQIKRLNTEGIEKYGKKWKTFALTDDEIKAFGDLKKGDEEGLKEVIDGISSRLGSEQYTSVMDKLLEARKIAMLLNPRTNVRNVVANVPTLGMRWLSDRVAAVGERAYKALVDPNYQLTQGLTGSGENGRNIAKRIYNSEYVQNLIKGTPGKYEVPELKNALIDNKTMYKGTAVDRFLESAGVDIQGLNKKLFDKDNVHSLAETTRNLNYKLLDLGDSPFVRENFIERLGSYVNAQGITSAADIPKEAIDLAWQEAMKATYKDNSWAVQMISGLKKGIEKVPGIGRPVSQAVIPFVQAPGNIAARMVDYSAIGGANGLKNIVKGTKGGDAKLVREGIDQLSKGLTGTGLVVAGIALHNAGIITGPYSKDKDQRNFQKQSGYREYALHVGDKYYTYDWAQPAAQNLILGTLLAEAINNSDQYDSTVLRSMGIENSTAGKVLGSMKEGAKASINSWFNESPMQGLAELMKGTTGSYDTDIASNLWNVAASDFASSFIPSVVNASAKTSDTTQRQTTDYDNTFTSFINQQKAKIPGLSETLPAKYDTWGREMKNGETVGEAAFARFFNPGDLATDKHDRLDDEINKLYEATKDVAVFPTTAPTSANGEKLSAQEYSDYQKDMGQRSHEMVQSFIDSDLYKSMSNEEKVKTISGIYSASKALTENKLYKKEIKNNAVAEAYLEGGAKGVVKYYATKQALDKYGISDSSKAGEAVADSRHPEKTAKELNEITHDLKRAGLLDKEKKQPPSEIVDIYEESGMRGVNDYVSVETNAKGGSYSGYQSMKKTIPYLTAKEYMDIYNTYSVPNKNGVYDNTFSQEEELIPYLTSRTWDNDKQLNQVAHILGPNSKGTWHIDSNNNLYYNKPSVEPWGTIENENVLNMVNLLKEK